MIIRNTYLNDRSELERLISKNSNQDLFWTVDIDSDLNTLLAQNITYETPNQTYCIIMGDNLIGFVHFYNYDEITKKVFMGYLLDKDYQKKGIMLNVCFEVIPMVFEKYTVKEINVITSKENVQSKSLIKKIGFQQFEQFYIKDKEFELFSLNKSNYSHKKLLLWH